VFCYLELPKAIRCNLKNFQPTGDASLAEMVVQETAPVIGDIQRFGRVSASAFVICRRFRHAGLDHPAGAAVGEVLVP